jgi:hypothetical protein
MRPPTSCLIRSHPPSGAILVKKQTKCGRRGSMQKIAFGKQDVSLALARMNPGDWCAQSVAVGPWHLGALAHPGAPRFCQHLHGILALGADRAIIAGLPLLHQAWPTTGAALVAALRAADGIFAAAIWCADTQALHIITDFLGLQSLYGDGTLWASDTKAFRYVADARGWGSFIGYGHLVGDDTLLKGVQRVGDARHITFSADGTVQEQRHWQVPDRETPHTLQHMCAAFQDSIAQHEAVLCDASVQLLLSGGYDSRLIGAALAPEGDITATILAHEDEDGAADGWIARRVAAQFDWAVGVSRPQPDFFSSKAYLDHLWSVDGAYPTHGLFIAQVKQHVWADAVWEGQLPNVSIRAIHPEGGFAAYDAAKRAGASHPHWQAAQRLLTPDAYAYLREAEVVATHASRSACVDDEIGVGHWVTLNRIRRRAGLNIYQAYAHHAQPLAAGASRRFWSMVQSHPAAQRRSGTLAMRMLQQLSPKLAALPLSTGGRLAGNIPLRLQGRVALGRFLSPRPRLAKLLDWPRVLQPSQFLVHAALYDEPHDWISPATLDALRRSDDVDAKTLLWHLRSTEWLHEGRLHAMLGL